MIEKKNLNMNNINVYEANNVQVEEMAMGW
jgi:hypothetical protein